MRKNRKITKRMSRVATSSMYIGAVIVTLTVMVIVNHLASASCMQLQKSIGRKKAELAKLENDRLREDASWKAMITPERLEAALRDHGMAMYPMREKQIIRMGRNGKPKLGQVSVALAQRRAESAASRTARYEPRRGTARR